MHDVSLGDPFIGASWHIHYAQVIIKRGIAATHEIGGIIPAFTTVNKKERDERIHII